MNRSFRQSLDGNNVWLTPRHWTNPITDVSFMLLIYYSLLSMGPRLRGLSRDLCTASPATTCGKNANHLNARERSCLRLDLAAQHAGQEKTSQIIAPSNSPLRYPFSVQLSDIVHASTLSSHQPPMTVTRHQATYTRRQPSATH